MTGDHIETARTIAVLAGIITEEEKDDKQVVMTAEDFMNQIGHFEKEYNYDGTLAKLKFGEHHDR